MILPFQPRKIILDTDPGGDDVFALLWLLSLVKQGMAELLAVTSTGGNVPAPRTFANACQVVQMVGLNHIEVGRGALPRTEVLDASHIHGGDGIGNLSQTLPAPLQQFEAARPSSDLLIEHLQAMPGEVTIVAIGPLTNLAIAELACPGILKQAKEIVVMAGAFHCPGNVTPHAEFNVWFDPEAARTVLNSCTDITLISLDVTRHLIFTREMAQAITHLHPEAGLSRFISQLCEFMIGTSLSYRETQGTPGFLVHDAATIGYLFYPETLLFRRAQVQVETKGEWTRGQTTIDDRHLAKPAANAWVSQQVTPQSFFCSLIEDFKRLL